MKKSRCFKTLSTGKNAAARGREGVGRKEKRALWLVEKVRQRSRTAKKNSWMRQPQKGKKNYEGKEA